MNRKLYQLMLMNHPHITAKPYKKPPSHEYSSGGDLRIKIWLSDDEHIELDVEEEYLNIMEKRSRYFNKEAIFDMLYRKYPEMFDE